VTLSLRYWQKQARLMNIHSVSAEADKTNVLTIALKLVWWVGCVEECLMSNIMFESVS